MNRRIRMRRFNNTTNAYDTIFPQTVTENVLRRDDGGVLETYLNIYDRHLGYPVPHINHAISRGTHRHLVAHIHNKVLVDHFPLALTLHTELDFEPTLDFNKSGPKPIINGAGERIPGGQVPGAILLMMYSEPLDSWVMMSNDNYSDITRVMTPVENQWWYKIQEDNEDMIIVPGFNRITMQMREVNYGQTMLIHGKDWDYDYNRRDAIKIKDFHMVKDDVLYFIWNSYVTTARRGHVKFDIENRTHNIILKEPTRLVEVPIDLEQSMSYNVIYGQTKLREGIDFLKDENVGIMEFAFELQPEDLLTIETTHLVETPGDAFPNNWGTKGTHRYEIRTSYGEYESSEDKITVIPVPKYNHRRDTITVIRDNRLLVFDVDYTIDLLDQIVLLNQQLNTGDVLHWTILHGAMVDVPNYNVIKASGTSGQHILVDIGWDQICDYYTLVIKLVEDLQTAPTIKCINGPARPVANCFGDPVTGGYKKGSFLWIVYNEENKTWYSLGHGQIDISSRYPVVTIMEGDSTFHGNIPDDEYYGSEHIQERVIPHGMGVKPTVVDIYATEPPGYDNKKRPKTIGDIWWYADETNIYVGNTGNATSAFHWRASNTDLSMSLQQYLESELAKLRAKTPDLTTRLEAIEITTDNTNEIPVAWWTWDEDIIFVNYGQTILRENIDFTRSERGLTFKSMSFMAGDVVQYTLIKQDDKELLH